LVERDLQIVIKPHPMDADRRRWRGAITISERDLVRAGVSLYGLLGLSRGLITDYSSVWVDYLLLDRPLAFMIGDRETYARKLRPPDMLDWLPGELVDDSESPFAQFFTDLDASGRDGSALRQQVAGRIGLNPSHTSADDLIDVLAQRGVLRQV
jgi:CDP-glycerol glycerophosphotransferase